MPSRVGLLLRRVFWSLVYWTVGLAVGAVAAVVLYFHFFRLDLEYSVVTLPLYPVISQDVARCTPRLMHIRKSGSSEQVKEHDVAQLFVRPNKQQDWYEWIEQEQVAYLLRGNAYAAIRQTEAEKQDSKSENKAAGGGPMEVKAAVTVRKPREEVEPAWRSFETDGGLSGWHSDRGGDGNGSGVSQITGEVAKMVAQVPELFETLTGQKVSELMERLQGIDASTRSIVRARDNGTPGGGSPQA